MPSSPSIFNDCCASGLYRFEPAIWVGSNLLEINNLKMVDQNSGSWNRIGVWLKRIDEFAAGAQGLH